MKISAVICEYNPFHNGHMLQTLQMRKNGATHILCIMSGNFVQRGEPAIIPKELRAKAALLNGADLILELPLTYASSTADRFAFGGVSIIKALGCVDTLSFGAECDNTSLLTETAELLSSEEFIISLKYELDMGITFATARQLAIKKMGYPVHSALLSHPNNILAIEYIKHLMGSSIIPQAIKRVGADHHSNEISENTASGSYIRENYINSKVKEIMPQSAYEIFRDAINTGSFFAPSSIYDRVILSKLRTMTIVQLSEVADISEGLEHKLYSAIQSAANLEELYSLIKSKRYTLARVRRLVLSAFLDLKTGENTEPPQYARILGMTPNGEELLSYATKTSSIPLSHSLRRLSEDYPYLSSQIQRDTHSTDVYNILLNIPKPCGTDFTGRVIKVNGIFNQY